MSVGLRIRAVAPSTSSTCTSERTRERLARAGRLDCSTTPESELGPCSEVVWSKHVDHRALSLISMSDLVGAWERLHEPVLCQR